MLESATEPISVMLRFCASLLFISLFAWATMKLIQDTRKAGKGKTVFKIDTIILYALALLTATSIYFFLPDKSNKTETHTESSASVLTEPDVESEKSAVETYHLEKDMTYVIGTMDEIMEWIQENEVLYVQAIFQLNDRESLATWRRLQPKGVPSEESRLSHDNEKFLHYAVIPDKAIQAKTTRP